MSEMIEDMSNLDSTFNWDNLSVGNLTGNATGFFERKHPEHSAVKVKKFADSRIPANKTDDENDENIENQPQTNSADAKTPESIDSDYLSSEIENIQIDNVQSSPLRNNNRANLRTKPITPKRKDSNENKMNKEFNVVRAGKLYEERKKLRMEELERIEREQRKFHSKPAPNFRAIHAAHEQKQDRPIKVTVPKTPLAIKHDRKIKQIWQKRREEYEESRKPKPFVSQEPAVLKQKPFVPKIEKKPSVEPEPFHLHSDERLRERRQFDEKIKAELERKQREEEEKKLQEEERLRRELRKQTAFKAQPNPFK